MTKSKFVGFCLLAASLLFLLFVMVKNWMLPYGDHLLIALRIASPDHIHGKKWYFHPVLSKFIYQHGGMDSCDLIFLINDNILFAKNAKIGYLLDLLVIEYDEEFHEKYEWWKNVDRVLLKQSIKSAASNCNPTVYPNYLGGDYTIPPLFNAIESRQEDIVKILLDAGADPEFRIDAPGQKVHGMTILEVTHRRKDNAKSAQDQEELDRMIKLLEQRGR
jgi:hypothetical protein